MIKNVNYNTENTINYLLELSGHTNDTLTNPQKDNSTTTTSENSTNYLDKTPRIR